MKTIAKIFNYENLPEWVDRTLLSCNGGGKEFAHYIVIEDQNYKEVYSDAMEREDACFSRDLNWIVKEIKRGR